MNQMVNRMALEHAVSDIRKGIKYLRRDLANAAGNKASWYFVLTWLGATLVIDNLFRWGTPYSLLIAVLLVAIYKIIESVRIHQVAETAAKEPLEPFFDTTVSLGDSQLKE